MTKVVLEVVSGVAMFYPTGQQGSNHTLKAGQTVDINIGPKAEPKRGDLPNRVAADLEAPAVGVARDEPFGDRDGAVRVTAMDGAVVARVYESSSFRENPLTKGESLDVAITESNQITLALYPAEPEPK